MNDPGQTVLLHHAGSSKNISQKSVIFLTWVRIIKKTKSSTLNYLIEWET